MQTIRIIKKNWEFQAVINKKNQIVTNYLIFYYAQHDFFEIGISIPKKFANAVKRNRFKRQIKNALCDFKKNGVIFSNFRIVLIARKTFLKLGFEEKKKHLSKIFEELKENEK
ncbi:ribonuclease P protein component [Mycoplasma flocculare]|uniref:Ribonuclease P protein component n=2 Tax=Mesomycoplasma flocculare TaxID=2128 RepID=A0A0A8E865_MESFC|nr:ribonuclease P protein component [Mesomycoplasma flocculare]MXR39211.1 ribonuclease P protein component [Mycoplasma sp. MF12]AJC50144.1 ribonuclease P protein subunit [Mesomycoplasma flocculare ATCC 27399]MXR05624.1 ribonuclease P protein component [Mesomycoplasma flocculare]MXR11995.1 ribonuclease P protein component [Mesomycoplasma flocculare]MXR23051.1 ribonuclease P protein component [Mesomycoplasma flocculare]